MQAALRSYGRNPLLGFWKDRFHNVKLQLVQYQ